MTLSSIIKEFLVSECGFSSYQVHETLREITVHLSGRKLHFLIGPASLRSTTDIYKIDCCVMRGDTSSPCSAENIERVVFNYIDMSDPESFEMLREHMSKFLPNNIVDSRK